MFVFYFGSFFKNIVDLWMKRGLLQSTFIGISLYLHIFKFPNFPSISCEKCHKICIVHSCQWHILLYIDLADQAILILYTLHLSLSKWSGIAECQPLLLLFCSSKPISCLIVLISNSFFFCEGYWSILYFLLISYFSIISLYQHFQISA